MTKQFTLALPSKGAIAEPTDQFLKECGLKIYKPNPRQYVGRISTVPNLNVLFQRVKDINYKVADGTAHLGITGLDVIHENPSDSIVIIHDKLDYGQCSLVVAVPEAWMDVESIDDLVEVALDFREQKGRNIRIATTYTHSARQFLHKVGIHHFTLVKAEGAIEAAPTIGYADFVIDLTQTGTTLRENHLKQISGGTIIESQACLIGNRQALIENPELMQIVRHMTEFMDAALKGRQYYQINVDITGESAQAVAQRVVESKITQGLLGPTVAPIYSADAERSAHNWYTVTLTVKSKDLLGAVNHLRDIGGTHVIASPVKYVFLEQSETYQQLLPKLGL